MRDKDDKALCALWKHKHLYERRFLVAAYTREQAAELLAQSCKWNTQVIDPQHFSRVTGSAITGKPRIVYL